MQVRFIEKPHGFDTKMRIAHVVTRPLKTMTVAEICNEAGVSRQTFYNHFESKYTIGSWYALYCGSFTLKEIGRSLTWNEGYQEWFSLMERERTLFGHSSKQDFVQEGRRAVALTRCDELRETIEEYRGLELTDDLDYFSWICARLEGLVTMEWFESGFATPAHVIAERMELCVPPVLYRALSVVSH